ncbi:DUF309 domain-containing protein [Paenibacillus sp. GCM10012307]|uniref:DUF309 domain-containing protein n=1 Tax=Paenibacillus roseus TaxID=2798579 RepID=A0A934MS70_9BACL|nr:DUF309 domain-containing protein [Paenibacillus roseus]MBJ6363623.1 DUF309 domain-containing protein [Paenibacillus roseus]
MRYAKPYIDYLVEFHGTRDYFECHELLEEHWKEQGTSDPYADTWVGLIQIAVGQYHHRRGNVKGAEKLFRQAERRLNPQLLEQLGLSGQAVADMVRGKLQELSAAGEPPPFRDMDLPFRDLKLERECRERTTLAGYGWCKPSRCDGQLVHRHTLRDRSSVIAARAEAYEQRRASELAGERQKSEADS